SRARHRAQRRRARRQRLARAARPQPRPPRRPPRRAARAPARVQRARGARALLDDPARSPARRRARAPRARGASGYAWGGRDPPKPPGSGGWGVVASSFSSQGSPGADHAAHRRRAGRARRPPPPYTARGAPLRPRPLRDEAGLRQARLRRVHGRRRWEGGPLLPDAGARSGRARRADGGDARRRAAPGSARRLLRSGGRRAVRVLYAGHADERDRAARPQPVPHARRDQGGDLGQPLPLYGLRPNRRRGGARRPDQAGGGAVADRGVWGGSSPPSDDGHAGLRVRARAVPVERLQEIEPRGGPLTMDEKRVPPPTIDPTPGSGLVGRRTRALLAPRITGQVRYTDDI